MRAILFIIGIVSAFLGPWWIVGASVFALSLRWRAWEVVVLGAFLDVLWFPTPIFWGIPAATLVCIVLVWLLEPLRNELLVDQPAL